MDFFIPVLGFSPSCANYSAKSCFKHFYLLSFHFIIMMKFPVYCANLICTLTYSWKHVFWISPACSRGECGLRYQTSSFINILSDSMMATIVANQPGGTIFRIEDTIFKLQGQMIECPVASFPTTILYSEKNQKGDLINGFFTAVPLTLIADSVQFSPFSCWSVVNPMPFPNWPLSKVDTMRL